MEQTPPTRQHSNPPHRGRSRNASLGLLRYYVIEVLDQGLDIHTMRQCPLLEILEASNGTAEAHEPMAQEHLDRVRVLLYYLTNWHILGDSQSNLSFVNGAFVGHTEGLRLYPSRMNCQELRGTG
jgi:hypothetical protein